MAEALKEAPRPTPDVSTFHTNLGLAGPETMEGVFRAHTKFSRAVVIQGWATGTVHQELLPLVKEATDSGISVFIISSNRGEEHGIRSLKYEPHVKAVEAGAIPLKDVNIKKGQEVLEAIQEQINHGKIGEELNEAIIERFGSPIPQRKTNI